MLGDQEAIAIASRARQKNVAEADRVSCDFDRIFKHFFREHDFANKLVLDLGPGQYDFARRVRERGGTVHNIDNDPAIIELGQHLGFEVTDCDLKKFDASNRAGMYDGLFCKFSVNAFWFKAARLEAHVRGLDSLLKPTGWGWIAPWNGAKKRDVNDPAVRHHLRRQAEVFQDCGWTALDLTDTLALYYGVSGAVANHALFLKNIAAPPRRAHVLGGLSRAKGSMLRLIGIERRQQSTQ
jgi:hypothetical protein